MGDALFEIIEKAEADGARLVADGTLAVAVGYDPAREEIRITLRNGCTFLVPAGLIEGLASASHDQRAAVEVSGIGYGLHWPALDLDLSVPGLVAGITGTRKWMDGLRAALGGASVSPAKAAAARRNGAKGGRPREVPREGG